MKSKKARKANETSAIVPQVGAIDASNVMVVCPVCNKATRVAYTEVEGKKIRVCKKCGASLDVKPEAKKAVKKAAKATDGAKKTTTRKTTAKKAEKAE
jgi:Zn ribbon nucleic-acid-binding protein